MNINKIVLATDYSEASQQALRYAAWMAQSTGATLYIVHVSEHEKYPVGEHFDEDPAPNPQELEKLQSIVPEGADVPLEHRLLYGEPGSARITQPAQAIIDFADKEHIDLIVVGTHGRSGLSHLLMGSVSESVVRHAKCPVITVRQSK
jgi:universal stress protein A